MRDRGSGTHLVGYMVYQTMTGMLAKFHRQMFCWIDEWIELTMEQVREYETQVQEEMRQVCIEIDASA